MRVSIVLVAVLAGCSVDEPTGGGVHHAQSGDDTHDEGPPRTPNCAIFPADNPWNTDISAYPVRADSDELIDEAGRDEALVADFGRNDTSGVPYVLVGGDQPLVPVTFTKDEESDAGPYPIPPDAPNQDYNSRVVVLDDDNCELYEMANAQVRDDGSWSAAYGAKFDLGSNALRPDGWRSADLAGLPSFRASSGTTRLSNVARSTTLSGSRSATLSTATSTPPPRHPWASATRGLARSSC